MVKKFTVLEETTSDFQVGDVVRVLPPFDKAFPDLYPIDYINLDGTCGIAGDRDFAPRFLVRIAL